MAARAVAIPSDEAAEWTLRKVARFPDLRALAWCDDVLYASRGYTLLRAKIDADASRVEWQHVGEYRPPLWRSCTSRWRLPGRLFRDGFHALAVLSSGDLVAVVPGAIITLPQGEKEFHISHTVLRGTRPLHIAVTPNDSLFWGEYFDNQQRDEVHVYTSTDRGMHWEVAYTFPKGAIRHVHNIVYDAWQDCLWVLTGDNGSECRILRAACDFRNVETILSGRQQARAVALLPTRDALYFSSDTPLERNYVYRLDRRGNLRTIAALSSSSISGCQVGDSIFFSTMVEPSQANPETNVCLYGSRDGVTWPRVLAWQKDRWPMGLFQYGNAFLPDGINQSGLLAVATVAVKRADLETTIWQI